MLTSAQNSAQTLSLCKRAAVIPVLVVDDVAHAAPLASALVAGGLPVLEVTLRTAAALDVIAAMTEVPGGIVGAGTVLNADDAARAKAAGATFAVSPGATPELVTACLEMELPLLPGAVTASEVMSLLARGITTAKFFPAETSGGAAAIKSLSSPLPQMTFCPTGGIGVHNASDYLALPNVHCVGGSWVAPKDLVQKGAWGEIEGLAQSAAAMGGA